MKKNLTVLICVLLFQYTIAQQKENHPLDNSVAKITLTGKVIEAESNQPLEYATIVLAPTNGKSVTGGITDSNGQFSIVAPKGIYNISVEFISFKTKYYKNKELTKNEDLGTIILEMDAESLDEVEVIAEKSTVEIRLDKKIYNVGKDMTVKGGTASDVLDNVPSVTVDVEGNVSLRGNENVRILVNGKPSGLVGLSGTDALRQLPAEAIEKVEVITSPSARYDAEGTAGILNIVLRKGKASGFNGSVTTTVGHPANYGVSANLNYRTKKINLFTNTGYSYRESPGNSFTDVTYLNEDGSIKDYRNEDRDYDRERNRFNTRFGLEYFLTDKSSITGTILYRKSNGDNLSTNLIDESNSSKTITREYSRVETSEGDDITTEYALNFTQDFNRSGHRLTLDFQYSDSEEDDGSLINDFDTYPTFIQNEAERTSTDEKSKEILIKGDYVLPLGETAQFEFGFKADLNDMDMDYLVEDFDSDNNIFINNTNFSNSLNFEQNIYSLYTQYGKKINGFSYLLGLRMENTDRKIDLKGSDEDSDKNFTELFPTVNLGLELSEDESVTLGYSRRLRRPRHWFLNPFESRTSETYIRTGNIDLDPTYTNSFDLGWLKKWNKFTLNSSIYYQHSINNFEMVQNEETRDINGIPTLVIIRNPINLSSSDRYGFEFTANYNPFKWWRLSNSFNFYKRTTDGDYNGVSYDSDDTSWFTRLTSRVTLPGKIDWQTRGMYRAPSKSALNERDAMFNVNLAFSKDIFKENGTLALNVSDLFNSRKRESTSYTDTTITEGEFQWRQRSITLNFTYRFNQKKKRQRQGGNFEDGGGEEEMFQSKP